MILVLGTRGRRFESCQSHHTRRAANTFTCAGSAGGVERREYLLVGASAAFTVGLSPYIGLVQGALVGVAVFFGTRALARYQKSRMMRAAGACARCGGALHGGACPSCSPAQE